MKGPARRAARSAAKTASDDASGARDKILAVFSAKAKRLGIHAVVMGELASELRMSVSTLYKHFASKDHLVSAMVDAWALELAAIDALDWQRVDSCASALDVLLTWADAWTTSLGQVPPAFFRDLRRDYPEQWQRFNGLIEERKLIAAEHLRPYLRDDVHGDTMLLMLDYLVMQAIEPRFVNRLGISRREAVRAALSVWGGGALVKRAKLRSAP